MLTSTRKHVRLTAGLAVMLHACGVARAATETATGTAPGSRGEMIPLDGVAGWLAGRLGLVLMALYVGWCARHGNARWVAAVYCVGLMMAGVLDGVIVVGFLWNGRPVELAAIPLVGGAVMFTTAITLRADVRRNFGVIALRKMQAMDAA